MKDFLTIVLVGALAFFLGLLLQGNTLGGVSFDSATYNTATNTTVSCSGATSTQVVGSQTGRTSFHLTASSSLTLCKASEGCVAESGIILDAGDEFEQDDGYYGAYSCIGQGGATSTAGIVYSE